MGFRICENCTEDRAVAGSDLCDTCEDALDENALYDGVSPEEYAKQIGISRIRPREGVK